MKVTADVDKQHTKETWQAYNERDVDEFYERDVDEYFERDVDEYFERDVDEYFERDVDEYFERDVDEYFERNVDEYYVRDVQDLYEKSVQDVYQRSIKDVYVPMFKKDVSYAYGTVVSGITYGYGTEGISGLPGGYLKNGMTYLTINDIEQYTDENPLSVWIADSSPKNNKVDSTNYNKNFNYFYELYVEDGTVFVRLDDRLIEAGFGILVSDKAFTGNPTSKVKHDNNPFGTAVKADSSGNTYVFFHADGISWYTTGEYEFVGWSLYDTEIGAYIKVGTEYGPCEYVDTEYGDYEKVDTQYGDWEKVDTQYGDWEKVDTQYGPWQLVNTIYGTYEQVLNQLVSSETITDPYNVDFTLTVTGPGGYNETFTLPNNGEVIIQNRTPGVYTCVLSGDDIADQTKYATVISGQQASVDFNDLPTVIGEKEIINNVPINSDRTANRHEADRTATRHEADRTATRHEADRTATRHETDRTATRHEADRTATRHEADRTATRHEADRTATRHEADNTLDPICTEAEEKLPDKYLPDNILPDERRGDETDPFGPYAIRLN